MSFRPPLWACLVTLTACTLFGTLSYWQYERGQQKADIIARRASTDPTIVMDVQRTGLLPAYGRRISITGHWEPERQVLLDNQTHQHAVGVHVWTPLRLSGSDNLVLVNRGWLATSAYRDSYPDLGVLPQQEVHVTGIWRDLPRAGLTGDDGACESQPAWPQRLNYPTETRLQCLYAQPLAPGLLLMDAAAPDGFVRAWTDLGIPPQRHYGYAVQWAALLLTALILFVVMNWKRRKA